MEKLKNLIEPLRQWALENQKERVVLVLATNEEKSCCSLAGTTHTIAKAIAVQAEKTPEIRHILLLGLFAASKNNRFLSLRVRLIAWLLK